MTETPANSEYRTPLIDEWMTKYPARQSDSVYIESRFPETLWVHEIDGGWIRVKVGPVTFTHKVEDMRLLLAAAMEWLDIRAADDAEIERHKHSHFCGSCSDRMSKGPGCNNCRNTGFDQTPCVGCPGGPK